MCVCVCVCRYMKVKVLVTQSCPSVCDPMYPLSMGFSRQEHWSG